jgi:site-specific recombinase
MQELLERFSLHPPTQADEVIPFFKALIAEIRPPRAGDPVFSNNALQALSFQVSQSLGYAALLRDSLLLLLDDKNAISLYADSGIQQSRGFLIETYERFSHKILPDAPDVKYLKDILTVLFERSDDWMWVASVPDHTWLDLLHALDFSQGNAAQKRNITQELKDALQVLSYRLSASGLDPELIRNHEDLENYDSPFITQNIEIVKQLSMPATKRIDFDHVMVMLAQCETVIDTVRKHNARTGTSIQLTALVQRIYQQMQRMRLLIEILSTDYANAQGKQGFTKVIQFFKQLVQAECQRYHLRDYWRRNTELLALRITDNASHTGEHYIAANRHEYFGLMKSALGAGFIIAFMAMFKIQLSALHLPPLTEAIMFSLNYGLGFVLIHILHFTVATKQPAMTAATIAATIDDQNGSKKNIDQLIHIVSQTISSQTIAIIGNVVMAIPVTLLIDWLVLQCTGHHFISAEKAHTLFVGNDPIASLALFYAAVAGVCLFLSGLIAGYHDNLAAYNRIPERINHLRWLNRLLGAERVSKIAAYIRNNLGALAGNFYFGFLLGMTAGLGSMLGLPLDIRHVTFVAAFFGYSSAALDYQLTAYMLGTGLLAIVMVGTVNLITSFSLAIYVAMKSRQVRYENWRQFFKSLLVDINQHPGRYFYPPKD